MSSLCRCAGPAGRRSLSKRGVYFGYSAASRQRCPGSAQPGISHHVQWVIEELRRISENTWVSARYGRICRLQAGAVLYNRGRTTDWERATQSPDGSSDSAFNGLGCLRSRPILVMSMGGVMFNVVAATVSRSDYGINSEAMGSSERACQQRLLVISFVCGGCNCGVGSWAKLSAHYDESKAQAGDIV